MATCSENTYHPEGVFCPAVNDILHCWPATPANTTVYIPCTQILNLNSSAFSDLAAFRTCLKDGTWQDNWTNYTACLQADLSSNESRPNPTYAPKKSFENQHYVQLMLVLKDVMIIMTSMSLVFLVIAFFIFSYFRSLQCSRNSIHKNLVGSFIFRFILVIVQFQPYMVGIGPSYRNLDWLCKTVLVLHQYFQMCNFAWMLVEGIYLHNRLVVSVFPSAAPFKLFYFIGWGIPMVITSIWAGLMHYFYEEECWMGFAQNPFIFIVAVPILLALVVNSAFLVNIIRVLIVKLRTNNLVESRRIRKAIKATVVLLPLLGVANLLFLAQNVKEGTIIMSIYRVINAVLPSMQGVFVSVLYCFMNSEVQNVIQKKWKRFRTNRAMNTRSRRQGSSTSFYVLSQSDSARSRTVLSIKRPFFRVAKANNPAGAEVVETSLYYASAFYKTGVTVPILAAFPSTESKTESYATRERDYHSLTVLNMTPEKETRNGQDPKCKLKKPLVNDVSLGMSKVPEVIETVCVSNHSHELAECCVNV